MSGKGDTPRPKSVDEDTFAASWDAIFKKTPPFTGSPGGNSDTQKENE